MSWDVDFTTNARADLVGLDPAVSEAVTDVLVAWASDGPPLASRRELDPSAEREYTSTGARDA